MLTLRPSTEADLPAITAIYRHYVENSVATFDTDAPGETFMAEKFGHMVDARHPVLIAEHGGRLAGYAYASTYRPRPAYRFTCEDSVYLAPDAVGRGMGTALLREVAVRERVNLSLALADGLQMVYLDSFREGTGPVQRVVPPGSRVPIESYASGHAVLAAMAPAVRARARSRATP